MKTRTKIKAGGGLGDCVAAVAEKLGLDKVAASYEQSTGQSCGCEQRREILNRMYPEIV
jgi:hypothetical protein